MKKRLALTIPIEPIPFDRPAPSVHGGNVWYNRGKYGRFKRDVARFVSAQAVLWDCPIRLSARFIVKRPKRPDFGDHCATKPDLSNYIKAVEDALEGLIWVNDSRICEYGPTGKFYDMTGGSPRIELVVEEL